MNGNGRPVVDGFVEVRNGAGKLLFEYDPGRNLVRIKPKGGTLELVDLEVYGGCVVTRLIRRQVVVE